jgi:2-dehydropantoate 2-reductase
MKVCIVGVGAIGGLIGTRLAAAGRADVSAIARGEALRSLRQHGWRLESDDESVRAPARAHEDPHEVGPQDLVVVAVKGPALPSAARSLTPLIGEETVVLPAMNGVPWWFGHGIDALGAAPLESVDPGGGISAAIPFARVMGCVVHASASVAAPGMVKRHLGNGLLVGEPGGGLSARARAVADLLSHAGFDARASTDIRQDIWYKLWGNLTINPISAITGATTDRILDDPLVREFCSSAMREASVLGTRIGCTIDQNPEDRHQVTRKLGRFKSSMLQDTESGRPLELDAIVGAVREMAQRVGLATPSIDALLGLARLFGRTRGLYPDTEPGTAFPALR